MINKEQYIYKDGRYLKISSFSGSSPSGGSPLTKITWAELKALRDNAELIPGMKYQITDYGCTTTQANTSSAGHIFDIIVEALSEKDLSEDAKATIHEGDRYFQKVAQKVLSAEWIQPIPNPEDIQVLYTIHDDEYYGREGEEEASAVITQTGTMTNSDGIEVPAIFNPDPDETGMDVWYLYNGTFSISEWKNDLISVSYTLSEDDEEIAYGPGGYHPEDLFCEIGYDEKEGTPIMYKNDYSDPELIAEGTDHEDKFIYQGDFELDGVTYNKWLKTYNGSDEGYEVLTNIIVVNNQFTITQEQLDAAIQQVTTVYDVWEENNDSGYAHLTPKMVNAEIEEALVPLANMDAWQLKYCLDNDRKRFGWASDKEGAVYDGISPYLGSVVVDGTTYYEFEYGDSGIYSLNRYPMQGDDLYVLKDGEMIIDDTFFGDYTYAGKGVIYQMIDEWQNEAPYDFKNILLKSAYTFIGESDSDGSIKRGTLINFYCNIIKPILFNHGIQMIPVTSFNGFGYHNTLGYNCNDNHMESCANNYLANDCTGNTLLSSINNKFENNCSGNQLYTAQYNTFGIGCERNTLSNTTSNNFDNWCIRNEIQAGGNNIFHQNCERITLGDSCYYNEFGAGCYSISLGEVCKYNTFGTQSSSIYLRRECEYNIFGKKCVDMIIGGHSIDNTFDAECSNIRLGEEGGNCYRNTFGKRCGELRLGPSASGNTFGNGCSSIDLGGHSDCSNNTFGDHSWHISFYPNCLVSYVTVGKECNWLYIANTSGVTNDVRNVIVYDHVCGTYNSETGEGTPRYLYVLEDNPNNIVEFRNDNIQTYILNQ